MKTPIILTPEIVAQVHDGLSKLCGAGTRIEEWHKKLSGMGLDVDERLFADVQKAMIALHADMLAVMIISETAHMKHHKVNMGWQCVPGVH